MKIINLIFLISLFFTFNSFFVQKTNSIKETFGVGTLTAVPSNLPCNSGKTNPTAFAAPVDEGIIDTEDALALLSSE